MGIPWAGIVHDFSKLHPDEWRAYTLSFYGGWEYKNRPRWVREAYDRAFLRHIHRNAHHWQWWVMLQQNSQRDSILPMPDRYRREMLADWVGASVAKYGYNNTLEWYEKNRAKILLHPETREWVEERIGWNR